MSLPRAMLVMMVVALWAVPAAPQTRLQCLHGDRESAIQMQRRLDALDGADLINQLLVRKPDAPLYPSWEALADSVTLGAYRRKPGASGDLARKMAWGTDEPLPGWRIHYVAGEDAYAFSLRDMRDPCQFTFATNDTGMVIEGRPARMSRALRVIPLDSTH